MAVAPCIPSSALRPASMTSFPAWLCLVLGPVLGTRKHTPGITPFIFHKVPAHKFPTAPGYPHKSATGDERARNAQIEGDCQRLDIMRQHAGCTHCTHDSAHCFDELGRSILVFLPGLDSVNKIKASLEIDSPMIGVDCRTLQPLGSASQYSNRTR